MTMNRREVCGALSAFAMLAAVADAQAVNGSALGASKVFSFDKLPVKAGSNGGESRAVMHGTDPSGDYLEVHETTLPAGQMPHPPHRHSNSEFILIREGKVEYLRDGHVETIGPGDVIYTASNKPHGMRNVGDTTARYFVVSVGVQDEATFVTLVPVGG